MNFVQSICIVVAGFVFGIALLLIMAGIFFLFMQGLELGFVSGSPDLGEYMKSGVIIGIGHGLLIALGVLLSRDRSSFISNISVGLLLTGFEVLAIQIYLFSNVFGVWPGITMMGRIENLIDWFLLLFSIFLIPTVLLALTLTKVATLSTRNQVRREY